MGPKPSHLMALVNYYITGLPDGSPKGIATLCCSVHQLLDPSFCSLLTNSSVPTILKAYNSTTNNLNA